MYLKAIHGADKQQGVGIIEVLVTVAIITIGFFALLALQMHTLENVSNSNQQFTATLLANEMGERIRANAGNITDYNGIDTHDTLTCTGAIARVDACAWKTALEDETQHFFSLTDKNNPSSTIKDGAQGEVVIAGDGRSATISVTWLEKIDRSDAAAGASDNQSISYELVVPVL